MTVALVDERIDSAARDELEARGYRTVAMSSCVRLSEAVTSHPDMLTLIIGDTLLTEGTYLNEARSAFCEIRCAVPDLKIQAISEEFSPEYPLDCLLNALVVGDMLFCREKSLSKDAIELARSRGLKIINVNQGYPACTVLTLGRDHAITADRGMARAMREVGIDVLLIEDGGIELPPHEYGFIGGATGVHGDKVYFLGDILTHPYGHEIVDFCREAGFEPISLGSGRMCDLGRIIFIDSGSNNKYGEQ